VETKPMDDHQWTIDPRDAGQTVERAYRYDYDRGWIRRTIDRSDETPAPAYVVLGMHDVDPIDAVTVPDRVRFAP